MDIDLARDDSRVTVSVRGELDLSQTQRLRSAVAGAFELGDEIVLDLSGVTFIDSTGMRAVLSTRRDADRTGRALTIGLPDGAARRSLDIAGLTGLLDGPG